MKLKILASFIAILSWPALAAPAPHPLNTNAVACERAPGWLTTSRLNRVVDAMQSKLEWDIRKIRLYWYEDAAAFKRAHGFDDSVVAITAGPEHSVSLGPRVDEVNFDAIFSHELVHVILAQKYKGAVPRWLEEGMANYLAKRNPSTHSGAGKVDQAFWKVDYPWLASLPTPDVYSMGHPFRATTANGPRYHYQASQALMEMIASKCSISDLVQLSVGKKLESYLPTFCSIKDINAEFKAWLKKKAKAAPKP